MMKIIVLFAFVCFFGKCEAFRALLTQSLVAFPFPPSLPEEYEDKAPAETRATQKELRNVRRHSPEEPNAERETQQEFQENTVREAKNEIKAVLGAQHGAEASLVEGEGSEMPLGPGEEKEEKARDKGEFVSNGAEKAGETFAEASMQEGGVGADQSLRDFKKQVLKAIESEGPVRELTNKDLEELRDLDKEPTDRPTECLRDYSSQCPQSFVAISNKCLATDSYKGSCAKIQNDLHKLSDEQKHSWAAACGDTWPCMPQTCPEGTNFDKCPVGWRSKAEGVCQAPDDYDKCQREVQFGLFSDEQKRDFENRCDVRWPCNAIICQRDFSAICPDKWIHDGNFICEVPDTYAGPCPKFANMTEYQERQDLKENFEVVCLTQWPCISSSDVCERTYDVSCPLGWQALDDGSCRAPYTYQPPGQCKNIMSFNNIPVDERMSFAAECEVDFPCKDRSACKDIDFSSRCPVDWADVGDGKSCSAPQDYDGPCDTVISFGDMSDDEKQYKISTCGVEWPCVGEWRGSFQFMHVRGPEVTRSSSMTKVKSVPKIVSIRRFPDGPIGVMPQVQS